MPLKLYNTLSNKKENFRSGWRKKVNIFVCGPTTYDYSHLGHARTYIVFDVICRFLRERRYKVFYLQNITDIDDKIINRAKEKNISWLELARYFENEYKKDIKALNIRSVNKYVRATSCIKEIISQIERLFKRGYAYKTEDGIYYDISKFKNYGKLSKRTFLQAQDAISRIDESVNKKNRGDFCLWKFSKNNEPKWPSPWGDGRPGWHIEDTAITEKYFGPQYHIHGGAEDLIFPHHEAEIAQMEAISGKKPLAKYWIHTGFLNVNGQKMAKSLGNFITIRDFLESYSPRVLRLFILKTHYHSPFDYTDKGVEETKKQIEKIDDFIQKLKEKIKEKRKPVLKKINNRLIFSFVPKFKKDFNLALEDDFNTPQALAQIFKLINDGNYLMARNEMPSSLAKRIFVFLQYVDRILGIIFYKDKKSKLPVKLLKLIKEREKYRKEKKWELADLLRAKIKELGYWIEDTEKGPKIKKIN